jgi:hypothetical protein
MVSREPGPILGPSDSWRFWRRLRARESVRLAEQLRVQLQECRIGLVDRAVNRAVAVRVLGEADQAIQPRAAPQCLGLFAALGVLPSRSTAKVRGAVGQTAPSAAPSPREKSRIALADPTLGERRGCFVSMTPVHLMCELYRYWCARVARSIRAPEFAPPLREI